jgi:hypothetical protein
LSKVCLIYITIFIFGGEMDLSSGKAREKAFCELGCKSVTENHQGIYILTPVLTIL